MGKILKQVEKLDIKDWKRTECDWTIELELKLENGDCVDYILNDEEKALFKNSYFPIECMKVKEYCWGPLFVISKWDC